MTQKLTKNLIAFSSYFSHQQHEKREKLEFLTDDNNGTRNYNPSTFRFGIFACGKIIFFIGVRVGGVRKRERKKKPFYTSLIHLFSKVVVVKYRLLSHVNSYTSLFFTFFPPSTTFIRHHSLFFAMADVMLCCFVAGDTEQALYIISI